MELWRREGFVLIGREGSTKDGPGFISRLWAQANADFAQIRPMALLTPQGMPAGIWGAMTDFSRRFLPWEEDFSQGLYLAGAECRADAEAPSGWTRWDVPGFAYLRVPGDGPDAFAAGLAQLTQHGLPLAGAVQEYTDPAEGRTYLCFPVERLAAKEKTRGEAGEVHVG